MKTITLIIALAAMSLPAIAQKNWISLRMHDFNTYRSSSDESYNDVVNKSWQIRPALGYYRIVNETWGLGAEFGYTETGADADHIVTFHGNPDLTIEYLGVRATQYYVCPSVFDVMDWKQYRLTGSLAVPVTYTTGITRYERRDLINKSVPPETMTRNDLVIGFPDQLSVGLFLNGGADRRLVAGLYCGVQLGFGFFHVMANGDRISTTTVSHEHEVRTITIEPAPMKQSETVFSFRPAISLSYVF